METWRQGTVVCLPKNLWRQGTVVCLPMETGDGGLSSKEFGNDMFSGAVFSGMEFGVSKITKSIFERGFGW